MTNTNHEVAESERTETAFQALRQWRATVARVKGLPPYIIATDTTLRGIAAAQPKTLEALGEVRGILAGKVAAYGAEILAVLAGTHVAVVPPPIVETRPSLGRTPGPWRVGDAGHTVFGAPNGNPSPKTVAANVSKADAKAIVEAVNAHDDLVAALEESSRLLAYFNPHPEEGQTSNQLRRNRAALAKATGAA